jgi:hypothetical protein
MDELGAFLSLALGQPPATGDPPPLLMVVAGWLQERFGVVLPHRYRADDE